MVTKRFKDFFTPTVCDNQRCIVIQFNLRNFKKLVIVVIKKGVAMFAVAAVISILLLALAGSDVFVSQYNSEELNNMGVQEK